ncbi:MAG: lysophospholipid acyltransferase family protein [Gammaproteobacteria bacterium]|nr:lysophospholipid acyltransferase family protein [Gammaproteobacteria bacterium]
MNSLRTWIWVLISCGLVVAFGIPLILSRLTGNRLPWLIGVSWAKLELWLLKLICGLTYSVKGKEHLPNNAAVALIKHSSAYETIAQLVIFPQQCWVLKRELIWSPFFGWALMALGAIPIDRSTGRNAVTKIIQIGKTRLNNGIWVSVFPEGTRVAPGDSKRWGISGIILAKESGKPVIPVAHNAGYFWPKNGWTIYPGHVQFIIGEAVKIDDQDPRKAAETLRIWVDSETEKLAPKHTSG